MKETLLAVMSHPGANAIVERHWPWYERAGCSIVGVGREGGECIWPSPIGKQAIANRSLVAVVDIGKASYVDGPNHLQRIVDLCDWFLTGWPYNDLCIIEYDGVFLKPLGKHPGGLCTFTCGYGGKDSFSPAPYYHTPWWIDRHTAMCIVEFGRRMIRLRLWEGGFVDRWLGLMVELFAMSVTPAPAFSKNALDRPEDILEARKAVHAGAVYVHGVKTPQQLALLTEGFE